jgi:hypothetical protein
MALHLGFEDADNGSVSDGKVDYSGEGAEYFANLKHYCRLAVDDILQ